MINFVSGGDHSLALDDTGKLWAWGNNGYGQLGNGSTSDSSTPVAVTGLDGVTPAEVAAGTERILAEGEGEITQKDIDFCASDFAVF